MNLIGRQRNFFVHNCLLKNTTVFWYLQSLLEIDLLNFDYDCFLIDKLQFLVIVFVCLLCRVQGPCLTRSAAADAVLYTAMIFAGMYAKFLTDHAQRKTFLETRRSLEMRCKATKENEKQEKLLLSGELEAHLELCIIVKNAIKSNLIGFFSPVNREFSIC